MRNKMGARRALACRTCRLLVEKKVDGERFVRWHTPGDSEHDCDGAVEDFDSKGEARTWLALCQAEDMGFIRELRRQPPFEIVINGDRIGRYRADFSFCEIRDEGRRVLRVVDAKGMRKGKTPTGRAKVVTNDTALSRFMRKCAEACHSVKIELWPSGETRL